MTTYHEDDKKLAKELADAHDKLSEVANRFYAAAGIAYDDLCKYEENFLKALHAARLLRSAASKLSPDELAASIIRHQ